MPDGDTGTNMSMTMGAAARELAKADRRGGGRCGTYRGVCASPRGARKFRRNSFSFVPRLLQRRGRARTQLNGSDLANALGLGVEAAYKAVMKPTEGTILTVSRVACEKGKAAARVDDDPIYVWSAICKGAAEALEETPEQLPVLKKAGVVDAGGKGLCYILDGMMSVFKDNIVIKNEEAARRRPDV